MFYSINSPIAGLSGLELATHLIKEASKQIAAEFPTIDTFSTLSPIPNFMKWLEQLAEGKVAAAASLRMPDTLKENIKSIYATSNSGCGTSSAFGSPTFLLREGGSSCGSLTDQEVLCWLHNILLKRASMTAEGFSDASPIHMDVIQKVSLGLCAHYLAKEKNPSGR